MAYKVFDLRCSEGHVFEAWFPSLDECERQLSLGLVNCPSCGSDQLTRQPTAAHLSTGADSPERVGPEAQALRTAMRQFYVAAREAAASAVDVGEDFAAEARAMRRGWKPERSIRGVCTLEEARRLLEEGILIAPLPESVDKTLC